MIRKTLTQFKKYLYVSIGSFTLVLGIIGAFFPLLPTTPFLLVTAFCYIRSSKKLYQWLITHEKLGPYIYDIMENHTIKKEARTGIILIQWASIIISIILISNLHVRIILLLLGIIATIVIMRLKAV